MKRKQQKKHPMAKQSSDAQKELKAMTSETRGMLKVWLAQLKVRDPEYRPHRYEQEEVQ